MAVFLQTTNSVFVVLVSSQRLWLAFYCAIIKRTETDKKIRKKITGMYTSNGKAETFGLI
jgi:hypothetical protein